MECILKRALRLALNDYTSDFEILLAKANFVSLEIQRQRTLAIETFKAKNGMSPVYLTDIFVTNNNRYNTRQTENLYVPVVNTTQYGLHSIQYLAAKIWNQLPKETKNVDTLSSFKKNILSWYGFTCSCAMCR